MWTVLSDFAKAEENNSDLQSTSKRDGLVDWAGYSPEGVLSYFPLSTDSVLCCFVSGSIYEDSS